MKSFVVLSALVCEDRSIFLATLKNVIKQNKLYLIRYNLKISCIFAYQLIKRNGGNVKQRHSIMTTQEIFAANQVLTVDIAKELIGKTIAVTNSEDRANRADVRICTVLGIETEFEAAKRNHQETYGNQQAMWIAENNERAIERAQKRLKLIYEGENPYATCDDSTHCLPAGTFFGSDADREIYYVLVDEN